MSVTCLIAGFCAGIIVSWSAGLLGRARGAALYAADSRAVVVATKGAR